MTKPTSTLPSWPDLQSLWPNRETSHFLESDGLRWHVQLAGTGPDLLLLHGTGSATHSWSGLLPRLATRFRVIAPDLPGHGFTPAPRPELLTLPGMAGALGRLLRSLGASPRLGVGHSAGAAVLFRMAIDRSMDPRLLIGLNPALVPPPAAYRLLFAPFVHRLATSDFIAETAASLARRPAIVDSLLRSTGSALTPAQRDLYRIFFQSVQHDHDVLTMMSVWSLTELVRDLPRLTCPVVLVTGSADAWIPRRLLAAVARRIPHCAIQAMTGGHLLHEERPDPVADLIFERAAAAGLR
jgi:magnesium chelatase accessory protein